MWHIICGNNIILVLVKSCGFTCYRETLRPSFSSGDLHWYSPVCRELLPTLLLYSFKLKSQKYAKTCWPLGLIPFLAARPAWRHHSLVSFFMSFWCQMIF